jgi:hypothetical protein
VKRLGLLAVFFAVACSLWAQEQPAQAPPAQSPPTRTKPAAEETKSEPVYVRRISLGLTGSVPALMLLRGGLLENETATPPLYTKFETNPKEHFTGGGATLQLALYERWSVNVNGIYRTAEYESFRTFLAGVNNPNTVADERIQTGITETTKARYFDFPVLVRRYNIGRHDYGHRWFVQAGPSLRYVNKIRTNRTLSDAKGVQTNESSPVADHKKNVLGVTAGFGGQLTDPVGLRVIPEVRYTRWFGLTFNSPPTRSRRDQVEFIISISF